MGLVCDGLQGGAKRYMLMGPSVSKADSSFISRYYTKQYTPARAHTNTRQHTVSKKEVNASHKRGVSGDGVCLYQTHTLDEQDDDDYYHSSGPEAESMFS